MTKAEFGQKFINEYQKDSFDPNETMLWLNRNRSISMSWGLEKPQNIMNKGLLFKVNGHHHKGFVLITLEFDDTYTVRFFDFEYEEVKEKLTTVYCDELQDRIDQVIECIDEYL